MNLITQLSLTCREYVNANGSKRGYSGCAVDIVFSVEVEENFIFLFFLYTAISWTVGKRVLVRKQNEFRA